LFPTVFTSAIDIMTEKRGKFATVWPAKRFGNAWIACQQFLVEDRATVGGIPITITMLGFEIVNGISIAF
jgi:hypothetical protein